MLFSNHKLPFVSALRGKNSLFLRQAGMNPASQTVSRIAPQSEGVQPHLCSRFLPAVFQGHPFMESLRENKPLLWSIVLSGLAIVGLLTGSSPEFNEQFGLVEIPTEVSRRRFSAPAEFYAQFPVGGRDSARPQELCRSLKAFSRNVRQIITQGSTAYLKSFK